LKSFHRSSQPVTGQPIPSNLQAALIVPNGDKYIMTGFEQMVNETGSNEKGWSERDIMSNW